MPGRQAEGQKPAGACFSISVCIKVTSIILGKLLSGLYKHLNSIFLTVKLKLLFTFADCNTSVITWTQNYCQQEHVLFSSTPRIFRLLMKAKSDAYLLVMSSSWNFPSWAEPKSFRAELSLAGHFNFWAETELDFFYMCIAFFSQSKNHSFNKWKLSKNYLKII